MGVKADVQWCPSAEDIFLTWGSDLQIYQTKTISDLPENTHNFGEYIVHGLFFHENMLINIRHNQIIYFSETSIS